MSVKTVMMTRNQLLLVIFIDALGPIYWNGKGPSCKGSRHTAERLPYSSGSSGGWRKKSRSRANDKRRFCRRASFRAAFADVPVLHAA